MPPKSPTIEEKKTEVTPDARKPSEQALQAVDVAVGTVPTVAENVRNTADTWRNAETRSQEIETLQKRVKTLRDPQAIAPTGLDPRAVERLWRAFLDGAPGLYWSRVWAVYVFIRWCNHNRVFR